MTQALSVFQEAQFLDGTHRDVAVRADAECPPPARNSVAGKIPSPRFASVVGQIPTTASPAARRSRSAPLA